MPRRGNWGRSSEVSFEARDSFTRRQRTRGRGVTAPPAILAPPPTPAAIAHRLQAAVAPQQLPPAPAGEAADTGMRDCALGGWCEGATVQRDADGKVTGRFPAQSYQAACAGCSAATAAALHSTEPGISDLPRLYALLAGEIGVPSQDTLGIHMPFGPSLPLRGDVDALMRGTVIVLVSWQSRVATHPQLRLSVPDPAAVARRPGVHVQHAARVLHAHLGPLIALEAAPMDRTRHNELVTLDLDGGDACAEILRLYAQARSVLGEVSPRPEELTGIRCYQCRYKALVRANAPLKADDTVHYSRCKRCGHQMTFEDYRRHCKRLLAVAQGRTETPRLAG